LAFAFPFAFGGIATAGGDFLASSLALASYVPLLSTFSFV
jgi:hypothetical protein